MDRDEAFRSVDALDVSDQMKESMKRTYDNLSKRWEREGKAASTVYQIDIPAQSLTICGEQQANIVLRTLKSVKVTGTYRATRK